MIKAGEDMCHFLDTGYPEHHLKIVISLLYTKAAARILTIKTLQAIFQRNILL